MKMRIHVGEHVWHDLENERPSSRRPLSRAANSRRRREHSSSSVSTPTQRNTTCLLSTGSRSPTRSKKRALGTLHESSTARYSEASRRVRLWAYARGVSRDQRDPDKGARGKRPSHRGRPLRALPRSRSSVKTSKGGNREAGSRRQAHAPLTFYELEKATAVPRFQARVGPTVLFGPDATVSSRSRRESALGTTACSLHATAREPRRASIRACSRKTLHGRLALAALAPSRKSILPCHSQMSHRAAFKTAPRRLVCIRRFS